MNINLSNFINEKSSSAYLFDVAKLLKQYNFTKESLEIINTLLERQDPFKYYFYNQLLHYKAILLSSDKINKFNSAIDQLKLLYSMGYHIQEPEILTLLGSNYKRLAFYSGNNLKKTLNKDDIKCINDAVYYYQEAIKLKKDKFYDFVNILYLEKILHYKENKGDIKKFIKKQKNLFKLLLKNWQPNKNDWWEIITYIEINVLLENDNTAELYLNQLNKSRKFDYHTSKRQMEIYSHFSPKDILFKDFYSCYKNTF